MSITGGRSMKSLYNKFVEKLIEQTKEGVLDWKSVNKLMNKINVGDYDYILFTTEFHTINFINSYCIIDEELSIFLLDEAFESGKDGSKYDGLNLYVIKDINGKAYKIPIEDSELIVLIDEIIEFINSKDNLDDLIKNYIENN